MRDKVSISIRPFVWKLKIIFEILIWNKIKQINMKWLCICSHSVAMHFNPSKQQKRRDPFQTVDKLCRKLFGNKHPFQLEYDMIINNFAFAILQLRLQMECRHYGVRKSFYGIKRMPLNIINWFDVLEWLNTEHLNIWTF